MTTIVFIPGLACDAAMWAAQLDGLAGRLPVARGDAALRAESLPAMARALLHAHDGPLILCGASMGGMLALQAALDAPGRIAGLALLGTSARAETAEIQARRAAAFRMIEEGHFDAMLVANLPFCFHGSRLDDAALLRDYLAMIRRAGATELVRQNLAIAGRPDLRPRLGAITAPTLVLCGDSDAVATTESSLELARLIPDAELQLLADCGHMLTLERPAEVHAALGGWLQRRFGV